ncbi:MAG: cytochrome c-type biogenesis protein CcmH [Xanthomonadales bacterium]|nr:cytochrome c-type biogenesis protein CcmH [Xanthomonadales bacterium]
MTDNNTTFASRRLMPWLAALLLCVFTLPALAVDPLIFSDDHEATRHQGLSEELRCLVCQNQSLADSDAPLAQDLRREVLDLMRQGMNDQEVKDYLVNRYSDFVLYRPRVTSATYLLWFGPIVLVLIALWVLFKAIRRQQQLLDEESSDTSPQGDAAQEQT